MLRAATYACLLSLVPAFASSTFAAQDRVAGPGREASLDWNDLSLASSWSARVWTAADGLPQNSVTAVAQTPDGYLWFGTFGGLVRFDGRTFTVFALSNTPELTSHRVTALCVDGTGRLWIGSVDGGLCSYLGGEFQTIEVPDTALAGTVRGIVEDDDGTVWVASTRTARFVDGRFVGVAAPAAPRDVSAMFLSRGRPVASRWTDPRMFALDDPIESRTVGAWLSEIVAPSHPGRPTTSPADAVGEAPFKEPRSLAIDSLGEAWIAAAEGIFVASRSEASAGALGYRLFLGRQLGEPRCVFIDREGSVWVGTEGSGVIQLRRHNFARFESAHGLPGQGMVLPTAHPTAGLWLTRTNHPELWHVAGGTATVADRLPPGRVRQILGSADGTLWVAGSAGVARLSAVDPVEVVPLGGATALARGRNGGILASGEGRILRFDSGNAGPTTVVEGLPIAGVLAMREARDGALWLGSRLGVVRLDRGDMTAFSNSDGAPLGEVRAIHEDAEGGLWFASYGGGLSRFSDGHFTPCTTEHGLPDNSLCAILEDGRGNLWVNSNRGVFRVAENELVAFAKGELERIHATLLATPEGDGRGAARTSDGRLWFSTIHGLVVIDPENVSPSVPPPAVVIEGLRSGQGAISPAAEITLAHGDRDVQLRFTSPSFCESGNVIFRYRLSDSDWLTTDSCEVSYSHLPPGSYRFDVAAVNRSTGRAGKTTTLDLDVPAYFYETLAFQGAAALALLALLFAGYRARIQRLESQRRRLHDEVDQRRLSEARLRSSEFELRDLGDRLVNAQEEERRRIARELHDDFAQRLAGVVIDTTLIAREESVANGSRAKIDDVTGRVREISDDLHRLSRQLHPAALEELGLVRALQSECRSFSKRTGIPVTFEAEALPEGLSREVELTLYRVVQESLRNVEKHARATSVRITLGRDPEGVTLSVEDSGRGFTPPAEGLEGGLGLRSMRERMRSLGGTLSVAGRRGQGARVEARVRLTPQAEEPDQ